MSFDYRDDLATVTSRLSAAYMTEHGALLCSSCYARNQAQMKRSGMSISEVPCHGIVLCTLCDAPANS